MKKVAVVFAAGQGKRFNVNNKVPSHKSLLPIGNSSVIEVIIHFLLQVDGLEKIIVVTGYQMHLFQFLEKKYSKVVLVPNSCFARHKTGCALLKVKKFLLEADFAYLIAGDAVCYTNYFLDLQSINSMAAVYLPKAKKKHNLFYKFNAKKEIIGFQSNLETGYVLGEFSTLTKSWIKQIFTSQTSTYFSTREVYEILFDVAMKHRIKVVMKTLKIPGPADIDYYADWEAVKQIFVNKD